MGFYYATERKRFEREWTKLRKEYETAGMTQETIQKLYQFDLRYFCCQRTYANHTQPLPNEYISSDKLENSELFRRYVDRMITFDEADFYGRYSWLTPSKTNSWRLHCRNSPMKIWNC